MKKVISLAGLLFLVSTAPNALAFGVAGPGGPVIPEQKVEKSQKDEKPEGQYADPSPKTLPVLQPIGTTAPVGTVSSSERGTGEQKLEDKTPQDNQDNNEPRQVPESFRHKASNFNELMLIFSNPEDAEKEANKRFQESIIKSPPREKMGIKAEEEKKSLIQETKQKEKQIIKEGAQAKKDSTEVKTEKANKKLNPVKTKSFFKRFTEWFS